MILTQKTRLLYFGITCIFSVIGLVYFRDILLPLAYSYTFAVFVFPLYRWAHQKGAPRPINLFAITITFLFVSISMIYLFTYAAQGIVDYLEAHANDLESVKIAFYETLNRFKLESYFLDEKGMDQVLNLLQYFSFSLMNYLGLFALSFVFYVFIFLSPFRLLNKYLDHGKLGADLRTYIKTKFVFSLSTAIIISFVLAAFEIQNWQSIAIFVFILNFIPNIGSIVATLLPLPMYFLAYGGGPEFWFLFISTSFVQFVVGNMIEPKVLGNLLNVPAIVVVVALLFWGKVWGALGVFFAVPSLIALYHFYPRIRRYLS